MDRHVSFIIGATALVAAFFLLIRDQWFIAIPLFIFGWISLKAVLIASGQGANKLQTESSCRKTLDES